MIAPWPLTPFEHYMLADHRPAYPMNIVVRLRFRGHFDRDRLMRALATTLEHHPLLDMQAYQHGRRWHWKPAQSSIPIRWLAEAPGPNTPKLSPLDVTREPGLRVHACANESHTDLILQSHHAACDGLGLLAFAEDLLVHYARTCPDLPSPPLPQRDPERLHARQQLGLTRAQFWIMACAQALAWPSILHYLRRSARPLVALGPAPDDAPPNPAYPLAHTQSLDHAETDDLVATARARGVTLNDLLLSTLYPILLRHQEQPRGEATPWLRLCVPISFRPPGPDRLPAVNQISLAFLNRCARDMRFPARFQRSIHREMQRIKKGKQGLAFILGLMLGRIVRGGLFGVCRARRCHATAVLSNPGRVFASGPLRSDTGQVTLGSLVLETLDFLTPVRPKTNVAFATFSYAGRLHVTLHYDPLTIGVSLAQTLLDEFMRELRNPSGNAPPQTLGT